MRQWVLIPTHVPRDWRPLCQRNVSGASNPYSDSHVLGDDEPLFQTAGFRELVSSYSSYMCREQLALIPITFFRELWPALTLTKCFRSPFALTSVTCVRRQLALFQLHFSENCGQPLFWPKRFRRPFALISVTCSRRRWDFIPNSFSELWHFGTDPDPRICISC